MATAAQRHVQDQNLNIIYNDVSKPSKKGGLGGRRKALNDISNSINPSVIHPTKKDKSTSVVSIEKGKLSKAPEKGKNGGRKPLGDLTNSVKASSKQVALKLGQKLDPIEEEGFLHNHQECINARTKAVDMDTDNFLKSVGLNPVCLTAEEASQSPSKNLVLFPFSQQEQVVSESAVCLTSKKALYQSASYEMGEVEEEMPIELEMEDIPIEIQGYCSPASLSPKSPELSWDEMMEIWSPKSPKLNWEERMANWSPKLRESPKSPELNSEKYI